jgi:tRNA/rRNA methyltransferase
VTSGPDPAPLVVVLVEPAGPLNVGSIARLCANFGVAELRLVAPRCDPTGEEARRMAVHGAGMLERARLFPTLAAALADCRRVVASSGRCSGEPLPLHDPATALAWLRQPASSAATALSPLALVFGREDHGLSKEELLQAGRLLCIGTAGSYGSLNLAQAAAIVLHQWQQLGHPHPASPPPSLPPRPPSPRGPDPCERASLEGMLTDAEALLLEVGFLYPHTAAARMAKLRALLQRSQPGDGEVALLRGMVRQLRWASQRPGGRPGQTP